MNAERIHYQQDNKAAKLDIKKFYIVEITFINNVHS